MDTRSCAVVADREGLPAAAWGLSAGPCPVYEEKGKGEILEGTPPLAVNRAAALPWLVAVGAFYHICWMFCAIVPLPLGGRVGFRHPSLGKGRHIHRQEVPLYWKRLHSWSHHQVSVTCILFELSQISTLRGAHTSSHISIGEGALEMQCIGDVSCGTLH